MIVNKIYSTTENDIKKISNEDLKVLEEISLRNGSDNTIESLFEYAYGGGKPSYDFNRTGGGIATGLWGLVQSIPSFAICSLISWPMTVIAGIGILSNRLQSRWEDKKSWLNRLDPRFWADYMGKPHELAGITKGGGSLLDRALLWPITVPARILGVSAGVLGLSELKDKLKSKVKNVEDEIFGFKKYKEAEKDKDGNVIAGADSSLSPEEIKNLVFREYWITLSNGEVLRVRADSEEHAKLFATYFCSNPKMLVYYGVLNRQIMEQKWGKYKFIFDDGEIAYGVGKTKDDAAKEALKNRKELCDALNESSKDLMPLVPLAYPAIINLDDVKPVYGEEIGIPDANKFKKVTTEKPNVDGKSDGKVKLPNPVYEYESLHHYRVAWVNFRFNMPSLDDKMAIEILRRLVSDRRGNSVFKEIEKKMQDKRDLYNVKFKDGDVYTIASENDTNAIKLGKAIHSIKIDVINGVIENAGGRHLTDWRNYCTKYSDILFADRNCLKSCETYPTKTKDGKTKDFNLKDIDKVSIKRLKDDGDKDLGKTINVKLN